MNTAKIDLHLHLDGSLNIAWQKETTFMQLRMFSAVFAPMPFTVMSSRNTSRSCRVAKPNRVRASSRTCSQVRSVTLFFSSTRGSLSNVLMGISTWYPTPLTSMTASVNEASIKVPVSCAIIFHLREVVCPWKCRWI